MTDEETGSWHTSLHRQVALQQAVSVLSQMGVISTDAVLLAAKRFETFLNSGETGIPVQGRE